MRQDDKDKREKEGEVGQGRERGNHQQEEQK